MYDIIKLSEMEESKKEEFENKFCLVLEFRRYALKHNMNNFGCDQGVLKLIKKFWIREDEDMAEVCSKLAADRGRSLQ